MELLLDEVPNDYRWRRNMLHLPNSNWRMLSCAARGRNDESRTAEAARGCNASCARSYPPVPRRSGCTKDYAGGSQAIKKGPNKLDPATREEVCQRYVGHVVPLLRAAFAAGFVDVEKIRNEPAFGPFQSDSAFQAILCDSEFPRAPFAPY